MNEEEDDISRYVDISDAPPAALERLYRFEKDRYDLIQRLRENPPEWICFQANTSKEAF